MGSVAGVLHVVPSDFVKRIFYEADGDADEEIDERKWTPLEIRSGEGIVELSCDFEQNLFHLLLQNIQSEPISDMAVAINVNAVGLTFASAPILPSQIAPGESYEAEIPIVFTNEKLGNFGSRKLDIAIKTSSGNIFAVATLPAESFTMVGGKMDQQQYRDYWTQISNEVQFEIPGAALDSDESLRSRNVFVVARRENRTYLSLMLQPGKLLIAEAIEDGPGITMVVKATDPRIVDFFKASSLQLLTSKQ